MKVSLPGLLQPVSLEDFFDNWFGETFLHVAHQDEEFYAEICDYDAAISLLKDNMIYVRNVVLMKKGEATPPGVDSTGLFVDGVRLWQDLSKGYTVRVLSVEQYWSRVADLCQEFEKVFGVAVSANMYVTPKNGRGSRPHFDEHDVFLLQIHGSKHWKVWKSPERVDVWSDGLAADDEEASVDFSLNQGDLLYIPRGHGHVGKASDETSIHLTIGVRGTLWRDVLRKAVDVVAMRTSHISGRMKPKIGSDGRIGFSSSEYVNIATAFSHELIRDGFLSSLHRDLDILSVYTNPPGGDVDLQNPELQVRPDLRLSMESSASRIYLDCGPRRITLDTTYQRALLAICEDGRNFTSDPPAGVDDEKWSNLLLLLLVEGILEPKI